MPTLGRADIDVYYDGKDLPAQARRLGEEAGAAQGEAHNKEFDERAKKGFSKTGDDLVKSARRSGEKSGSEFGDGFGKRLREVNGKQLKTLANDLNRAFKTDGLDEYARKLQGIDDGFGQINRTGTEVQKTLDVLREKNLITEETWTRHGEALREWQSRAASAHSEALGLGSSMDRFNAMISGDGNIESYTKRIDGLRQPLRESRLGLDAAGNSVEQLDQKIRKARFGDGSKALSALARFTAQFDGVARAAARSGDDLAGSLERVDERARRTGFGRFTGSVRDLGAGIGGTIRNVDMLGDSVRRAGAEANKTKGPFGSFVRSLSSFDPSDNLGQLLAIIIAFLPQIAVLASAAAGGLVILGGAITAAGLGLGGLILGFQGLGGDLKKLPASVRPAGEAFQSLFGYTKQVTDENGKLTGKLERIPGAIDKVRSALQVSLFDNLAGPIRELSTKLIPALETSMGILGGALNKVLSRWISDLNSSDFDDTLEQIFTGLAPSIENLGQLVSNVFGIIGELLKATSGDVDEFTGGLSDATSDLLAFLKTPEGHNELRGWIDDAKNVLATLGGVIGEVAGALGDLVSDPKNVQDTLRSIVNIGKAAESLAGVGENLGSVAADVITLIRVFAQMAEVASTVGNTIATVVETVSTLLAGVLNLVGTLLLNLIGGPIAAAIEAFKGLGTIIGDLFSGNVAKIPEDFAKAQAGVKKYTDDMGSAIGAFVGNAGSYFDLLDSKSQTTALQIAGNFGYTGEQAKQFAGNVAQVAANTGTSLSDLANDKSLGELAGHMNITKDAAGLMLGGIQDSTTKSGSALGGLAQAGKDTAKSLEDSLVKAAGGSLNLLKANAATSLDDTVKRMGASGKAAATLTTAFQKTAGDSETALKGLSRSVSFKDIEAALGGSGRAAKEKMANNIIAAAAQSNTSLSSLPPVIQRLVEKYGTIPKDKSTTVRLVDDASSKIADIASKLGNLKDKTVVATIINRQINQQAGKGVTAVGGIMAGGQLVAGGKYAFAGGGILNSPQLFGNVLAGEAGSEAIVPLTGPLNQVDASVRELAAYARGVGLGGGGYSSKPEKSITVAEGAVKVYTTNPNGEQIAGGVIDRLVPQL